MESQQDQNYNPASLIILIIQGTVWSPIIIYFTYSSFFYFISENETRYIKFQVNFLTFISTVICFLWLILYLELLVKPINLTITIKLVTYALTAATGSNLHKNYTFTRLIFLFSALIASTCEKFDLARNLTMILSPLESPDKFARWIHFIIIIRSLLSIIIQGLAILSCSYIIASLGLLGIINLPQLAINPNKNTLEEKTVPGVGIKN